jgi:hypothetical protein
MQSDEQRTGLLPGLSPEAVARTAIDGFLARQTVITPGMLAWLTRLGLKVLPQRMLVAFVRSVLRGALDGEAGASRAPASATPPRPRRLPRVLGVPGHILVLVCIAATLALQVGLATRKAPHVDSGPRSAIAAAASLLEHGVYADAVADGSSGRLRTPLRRAIRPSWPAPRCRRTWQDHSLPRGSGRRAHGNRFVSSSCKRCWPCLRRTCAGPGTVGLWRSCWPGDGTDVRDTATASPPHALAYAIVPPALIFCARCCLASPAPLRAGCRPGVARRWSRYYG